MTEEDWQELICRAQALSRHYRSRHAVLGARWRESWIYYVVAVGSSAERHLRQRKEKQHA